MSVWQPFLSLTTKQQGTFSEKDEQLRLVLTKLDSIDSAAGVSTLTVEDLTHLRRQLSEGQALIRDTLDRLGQKQDENDMIARRKEDLEARLAALEAEYEELLGTLNIVYVMFFLTGSHLILQRRPSMMKRRATSTWPSPWLSSR